MAYCLLGYLCGYYRYYYPLEFITSYLNNAANDDDIRNGTAYAEKLKIKVTMPKWGLSKGTYFYDKDKNIISKGVTSIKYMSDGLAEELYELAHEKTYVRFTDVLIDVFDKTGIDVRKLDILIKLDFFSEFGNQRELLRITDMFLDKFKKGEAKKIRKAEIEGTPLEDIVRKYAVGVKKSGEDAKSYTLLDVKSIMYETEDAIKAVGMEDLSDLIKIQNAYDVMGYMGYTSGKNEDRRKLYILDVFPQCRKRDGVQFGYVVRTKSIGSGVEGRFTVYNSTYKKSPIRKNEVIYCNGYERNGIYYTLTSYEKIIT